MCCCVSCRGVISPTDKHIPTDGIWEMTCLFRAGQVPICVTALCCESVFAKGKAVKNMFTEV